MKNVVTISVCYNPVFSLVESGIQAVYGGHCVLDIVELLLCSTAGYEYERTALQTNIECCERCVECGLDSCCKFRFVFGEISHNGISVVCRAIDVAVKSILYADNVVVEIGE